MPSQPISLPTPSNHDPKHDSAMGSYPGNNAHFNPSSYTRQFLGSPLSWRTGSFGGRVYMSSSPGMCIDTNDFKSAKMSSSLESDRGSVINALNAFEQQGDLCRNYYCCGKELPDLHALVDHFEDVHVVVLDPLAPQIPYPNPNAAPHSELIPAPILPSTTPTQTHPHPAPHAQSYFPEAPALPQQAYQTGPFDPDDMEMDEPLCQSSHSTPSSGGPTPPDTPISTPLSSYQPAGLVGSGYISQPASPFGDAAFDTAPVLPRHSNLKHHAHPFARSNSGEMTPEVVNVGQYPFNAYAGYSDWSSSMPGTVPSPPASAVDEGQQQCSPGEEGGNCVPPALLFSTSTGTTPANTPDSSRVSSPLPHGSSSSSSKASTTLSRPASSLLLSKPFKCPKPNCNKSYKQANGLKYHVTHGSCSLKPVREVEAVRVLLASKSSSASRNNSLPASPTMSSPNSPSSATNPGAMTQAEGEYGLTQEELLEVEKRVRPFACGIGECTRRYKNMNGLRYHYGHTGDHGLRGLEMLAKGVHECLPGNSRGGSNSRPETPEYAQSANMRDMPLQPIEPPQLDPAFQAQPIFAQPSQVPIRGQAPYQMSYPVPQQSYTLAGAMGPEGVYGGGNRNSLQTHAGR